MTPTTRSTDDRSDPSWPEATARLAGDPAFGPLVERVGPVRLRARRGDPFESLVAAIIYQQLAGAAARTIHRRFVETLEEARLAAKRAVAASSPTASSAQASDPTDRGVVTPAAVLALTDEAMRSAGLSQNKASAIRNLAEGAESGALELDRLADLSDEAVADRLVTVRGIGPWTAQMFLLFDLRRPDVWPTGDLGVRKGLGRVLGLPEPPTPRETELIGTGYRPWRSAVAWYCWRATEVVDPGSS